MNARKARSVRVNTLLQWPFGIGGRSIPLAECPPPGADRIVDLGGPRWHPKALLNRWKRRQVGQQDKSIGIAELAAAIAEGRSPFPSHEFTLHMTELTLAIQGAGPDGASQVLSTRFEPFDLPAWGARGAPDYKKYMGGGWLDRAASKLIDRMHKH